MAGLLYYFVEGECEAVLLKSLMHSQNDNLCINPGRVEILNVIYNRISETKARTFRKGTKVVFVFDTDIQKTDVLEENMDIIAKYSCLSNDDIFFLMALKNLEDELVYSCDKITNINEIFHTNGKEDFKRKFISHKDLVSKLSSLGFDLNKIWHRQPKGAFKDFSQGIEHIVKKQ